MSPKKGMIALMGSGELTSTMVEVHKKLLAGLVDSPQAVFLDTPAGFQLNVDQISQRALEFFRVHVGQPMSTVSYKSKDGATPYEAEHAFQKLREADFVLMGPGSPTYAVRQWQQTPIHEILVKRVEAGGCLVAASAAALTVGRFTLPVYEIYKVGEDLHWVDGMDVLARFGLDLAVIPHWNNAEGGTHDTRFCYMGESRFLQLESLLPEDVSVLGVDEHTACLIDLEKEEATIKGIGCVTLRSRGNEMVLEKGGTFSLEVLRGGEAANEWKPKVPKPTLDGFASDAGGLSFWDRVHAIEEAFRVSLEEHQPKECINALLELDGTIWKAQHDLESEEFISQAREILRELIVLLGMKLEYLPRSKAECVRPLVEELLQLRQRLRRKRQYEEADALRQSLYRADVIIEDTKDGSRWRVK